MTSYVENETDREFPFDVKEILEKVAEQVWRWRTAPTRRA